MKIGIYGATGSSDFGDYAMLVHNLQKIWNISKDSEFYIFTPNKYITLQNLVDNIIDYSKLKQIKLIEEPKFQLCLFERIILFIECRLFNTDYMYRRLYKKFCSGNISRLPSEFLNSMKEIDFVLFNGGGYVQDYWEKSVYSFSMCVQ